MNPHRLAISVTHADGRVTRWGPDEPDAAFIPIGLTFSTSMPGGYSTLSLTLKRRIDLAYPDLALLDNIRVYGPGGATAWDGRVVQLPREHGDEYGIQVGAVGWAANLRDDPTFRMVYVDRDLGHLHSPSLARRQATSAAGELQASWVTVDNGGVSWDVPALSGGTTLHAVGTESELVYTAPAGVGIAKVMYRGTRTGTFTNYESARVYTDSVDTLPSPTNTALTLDDTLRTANTAPAERSALMRLRVNTAHAGGVQQALSKLAFYGDHGLTTRAITGEPDGVYASDVIGHIVTQAAPELTYVTGTGGIEATTFAIPHLAFLEPLTAEEAILFVNAYHQWEWGVYDNKRFFYRPPDETRLVWEARLSEGAHLNLEGDQADDVFNGVYVTYTDGAAQKTVGPPGSSADSTSASLADTTSTNPVNAHGITRRWKLLTLPQPTTLAGAVQLGQVWLSEHLHPQRRGSLTVTGTLRHPAKGEVPAWEVRAGDFVRISDHPADVPRRIINTTYDDSSRRLTCSLDNSNFTLPAILERLDAYLTGR